MTTQSYTEIGNQSNKVPLAEIEALAREGQFPTCYWGEDVLCNTFEQALDESEAAFISLFQAYTSIPKDNPAINQISTQHLISEQVFAAVCQRGYLQAAQLVYDFGVETKDVIHAFAIKKWHDKDNVEFDFWLWECVLEHLQPLPKVALYSSRNEEKEREGAIDRRDPLPDAQLARLITQALFRKKNSCYDEKLLFRLAFFPKTPVSLTALLQLACCNTVSKYHIKYVIEEYQASWQRRFPDLVRPKPDWSYILADARTHNNSSLIDYITTLPKQLTQDKTMYDQRCSLPLLTEKIREMKGRLFVIASRPAMGKTSLLCNIVEDMVFNLKLPTLMFSCEMPSVQLVEHLLSSQSGVSLSSIRGKSTNRIKPELGDLVKTLAALRDSSLIIDDTPSISILELQKKARIAAKENDNLGMIGIDYLQLLRPQNQQNIERKIAEISEGLKDLAKELNVPIIVLSQLGRTPENRKGLESVRPQLSDFGRYGAIVEDADVVGLLYRKAFYDKNDTSGEAELIIAKNRNAPLGTVYLDFDAAQRRFTQRDVSEKEKQEK